MLTLARSRKHAHPSKVPFETPIVIPSFSSKGYKVDNKGRSALRHTIAYAAEALNEATLVSAYDIYYRHVPEPKRLPFRPSVLFVDSGGYEISPAYDLSHNVQYQVTAQDWDEAKLEEVYAAWPRVVPAVFVTFDDPKKRRRFSVQVRNASELAKRFQDQMIDFLIKPESTSAVSLESVLPTVLAQIDSLRAFGIVGLTEKELGDSPLDRMCNISRLRVALDRADIAAPIHVFGALDPISVMLYFISGAEIFDGLTWLRYSLSDGSCQYKRGYGALAFGVDAKDDAVERRILSGNIIALQTLRRSLRDFVFAEDFSKFGRHADFIRNANDSRRATLGE